MDWLHGHFFGFFSIKHVFKLPLIKELGFWAAIYWLNIRVPAEFVWCLPRNGCYFEWMVDKRQNQTSIFFRHASFFDFLYNYNKSRLHVVKSSRFESFEKISVLKWTAWSVFWNIISFSFEKKLPDVWKYFMVNFWNINKLLNFPLFFLKYVCKECNMPEEFSFL